MSRWHEVGATQPPQRGEVTWAEFLAAHARTLWACDFFTKTVWTWKGPKLAYVLFFLHVHTRRVIVSPAMIHPTRPWTAAQAEVFMRSAIAMGFEPPTILLRDGDGKFGVEFNETLRVHGCSPKQLPPCSPQLNAFAERWVRTVKRECLDHFIAFGLGHVNYLLSEFIEHYHGERPHQGVGNRLLPEPGSARSPSERIPPKNRPPPMQTVRVGRVVRRTRLGGVLKHYFRAAA